MKIKIKIKENYKVILEKIYKNIESVNADYRINTIYIKTKKCYYTIAFEENQNFEIRRIG